MCYLLKTSLHQIFWKHVSRGERGEVQWLESFGYIRNLQGDHVSAVGAFTGPWKRSILTHVYTSKMASLAKRTLVFGIQTNQRAFLHSSRSPDEVQKCVHRGDVWRRSSSVDVFRRLSRSGSDGHH